LAPERVEVITVRFEGVTGAIVISARGLKPDEVDAWWGSLTEQERFDMIMDSMYPSGITSSVKDVT
jgi:predicted transcriptional regulator